LSSATGVPGFFVVERSWQLDAAESWERRVHRALASHRVSGEHFKLAVHDAVTQVTDMLRTAGLVGADGLTERERAKLVGAEKARREAEARAAEQARQAEAQRIEREKAEQRRQAEVAYEKRLHRSAFWPRFIFTCFGVWFACVLILSAVAPHADPDKAGWILGLPGVALAGWIASAWATKQVAADKARAIRQAEKQAAKAKAKTDKVAAKAAARRFGQ
jgi:hypothetical protein